jgi:serine/threonine protein kinase
VTSTPNWDVLRELETHARSHEDPLADELRPLWDAYAEAEGTPTPLGFLNKLLAEERIGPFTHARLAVKSSIDLSEPETASVLLGGGETLSPTEEGEVARGPRDSHYDVLAPLGKGGMGIVREAREAALRRRVALKTLTSPGADSLARFVREAQITAQLDHPYVVPVYALEAATTGVSYAMKLVRGRTLAELIVEAHDLEAAGKDLGSEHNLDARLDAFLKTCDAVAFAHEKGVIHRDLKPANVMTGPFRELYVLDWGLAQVLSEVTASDVDLDQEGVRKLFSSDSGEPVETMDGEVVGTPAYMSPEQALGDHSRVGPLSDQFALGLILHELLALQPPYPGETILEVLKRAQGRAIEPCGRRVHPELRAIVGRATRLKPGERYASVEDLADDVRRHMRGVETRALPDGPPQRLYRWMRSHQRRVVASAVVLFMLCVAGLSWREVRNAQELERREQSIGELVNHLDHEALRLTSWIGHYQGLAQQVAGAATHALLEGRPSKTQGYGLAEFSAEVGPPGVGPAQRYGQAITVLHPLAHVPPRTGEALASAQADLSLLLTLTPRLRSVFLSPDPGASQRSPGTDLEEWIRRAGHSVHWVYVTSPSGAIVLFPGARPAWTPDHDATLRPWFRRAFEVHAATGETCTWTAPYVDQVSRELVITVVQMCLDPSGKPVGTAALDLLLKDLRERLWKKRLPGMEEAFLLSVADSSLLLRSGEANAADSFPYPEVLPRIREVGAGVTRHGSRLTCWRQVPSTGFALVLTVDAERYLENVTR